MRLHTSVNSPFGARLTIALKAKGVSVDEAPLPAGGLRAPEFLALNPLAKIPVLEADDGTVIVESATILDYIEDRWPEPSLRPSTPEGLARVAGAIRLIDTYVMAPVIRLFPHLDPARRDPAVVAAELARWTDGLDVLAHFLRYRLPPAPAGLSLADCALPPALHLSTRIAAMLGEERDPLSGRAPLIDYFQWAAAHPIVGPVLAGLTAAQEASDLRAGRPSVAGRHRAMLDNRHFEGMQA